MDPGPPLHPEGMAVYALKWCYQNLRESSRRSYKSIVNVGVLVGVITCVGVCVCFGHKTTCEFALVFSVFFGNLMLEFL